MGSGHGRRLIRVAVAFGGRRQLRTTNRRALRQLAPSQVAAAAYLSYLCLCKSRTRTSSIEKDEDCTAKRRKLNILESFGKCVVGNKRG